MTRRYHTVTLGLWVLGTALLPAIHATSVAPTRAITLAEALIAHLEARTIDCPSELGPGVDPTEARCVATGQPVKAVKRLVRKFLKDREEVVPLPGGDWRQREGREAMVFFVDREMFRIVLDEAGEMLLVPHQSCFTVASLEKAGVADSRTPGVEPPELLQEVVPDYPAQARVDRISGLVMAQAVVDREGSVRNACVLYFIPEGYGFEKLALESVRAHRYRPARRGDEPVEYLLNIPVSWEIR